MADKIDRAAALRGAAALLKALARLSGPEATVAGILRSEQQDIRELIKFALLRIADE